MFRIRDAYPGSLILIFPHPDLGSREILNPESKKKKKGEGKWFVFLSFFCCHQFLKRCRNFFLPKWQRIKVFFTQKILTNLLEICIEDPGSKILDPEKTFPGSGFRGQKAPAPGSGSTALLVRLSIKCWKSHVYFNSRTCILHIHIVAANISACIILYIQILYLC